MATSESKGELVIPIMVVQSFLLLSRPFVPKIVHVEHRRVTVNLMTCVSQEQPADQKIVLLLIPVLNVINFFQTLIVVLYWKMVVKIAGMDATNNKESVTGVERTVGAAEKIGLEVGVMVKLGDHGVINAFLNLQILD